MSFEKFKKKWFFFSILKIFWWSVYFKRVLGHQKHSFYQIMIIDVAWKNYWKWPKFLSIFFIFGQNFQFFGPKFFMYILYPKIFLCAKSQVSSLKTWFYMNFFRFWSKIAKISWPSLTLDPCPGPPMIRTCLEKTSYGPKIILRNVCKISNRYTK